MHALAESKIPDRINRVVDLAECCLNRGALVRLRREIVQRDLTCPVEIEQLQTIDHVVRGDCVQRLIRLCRHQLAAGERRQLAQRCNEAIELCRPFVQRALEAIAKQGAEWLSLSHAVDQSLREANTFGGEIQCKARARCLIAMHEICGTQYRRSRGLCERRCVDEAVAERHVRARAQVLDPPVAANIDAIRLGGAQFVETTRRERRNPRVKTMGAEVESFAQQPLKRGGRYLGQTLKAGKKRL